LGGLEALARLTRHGAQHYRFKPGVDAWNQLANARSFGQHDLKQQLIERSCVERYLAGRGLEQDDAYRIQITARV
jgi:hypothetical protein